MWLLLTVQFSLHIFPLLFPMGTIRSFGFGSCHLRKCFHKENDVNTDSPYFFATPKARGKIESPLLAK